MQTSMYKMRLFLRYKLKQRDKVNYGKASAVLKKGAGAGTIQLKTLIFF